MNFSNLRRYDVIAAAGGLLLAISVFVKCYETRPQNPNAQINGMGGPDPAAGITAGDGTYSVWQVHDILRFLLLLAAISPFILAWIIVREHELSWSRGEMTAVVAIASLGLIFYFGIIDRPGEPSGEIELEIGWYGLMLGAILMLVGAVMRSSETEKRRKPPGVL